LCVSAAYQTRARSETRANTLQILAFLAIITSYTFGLISFGINAGGAGPGMLAAGGIFCCIGYVRCPPSLRRAR
jgi:hypothetical protein